MKVSRTIDASRMIEIEENIQLGQRFSLTSLEKEYLEFAMKMPLSEIKTFLEFYDNSRPKYDEIKFVSMLKIRYNETYETVIKRIRQVRRIMKYEKELQEMKTFSKTLNKD